MSLSDEERAVIYELIDELLRDFDDVSEEWIEGYITTGDAIITQKRIREAIHTYRAELEADLKSKT